MPIDESERSFGMVTVTVKAQPILIGDGFPLPEWANTIAIVDEAIKIVKRRFDEHKQQEAAKGVRT